MNVFSSVKLFFYVFCATIIAMAMVLFAEYVMHLPPCPMCIFQRVAVIGGMLVSLIACLHRPRSWGIKVYAFLLVVIFIAGISIALRQVHLQNNPPLVSACGAGFNYLIQENGFFHAFKLILQSSGDCSKVHLRVLGLSIAGWSAIYFAILILVNLYQLFRGIKKD